MPSIRRHLHGVNLGATLVLLLSTGSARAEELPVPVADETTASTEKPSSTEPELIDFLTPIGKLTVANTVVWLGAKYVLRADYANISLDSMATNLDHGFVWDDNAFVTNQVGHPYQGGLYHSGARMAGLSFWQSLPYTVLGSVQWELFMETEHPAINDLITTAFGGIIVGESLYRISHLALDDSSSGLERVAREVLSAAINPVVGLERLLSGAVVANGPVPRRDPLRLGLSLGADRIALSGQTRKATPSFQLRFDMEHGDHSNLPAKYEPFDHFTFQAGINISKHIDAAERLNLTGLLAVHPLDCGSDNHCFVAAVQHFDFFSATIFKVGTSSLGPGIYSRWALPAQLTLSADLAVLGIALGGFDSPHTNHVGRDYNLGHGANSRLHLGLARPGWGRLQFNAAHYWVRIAHGATGDEFAGIVQGGAVIELWGGLGLEVGIGAYNRAAFYDDFDEVERKVTVVQLHLLWDWQRAGDPG